MTTIIPAASRGSLGDEAAVLGLLEAIGPSEVVRRSTQDKWGGSSFLQRYVKAEGSVYCIGADVLDGAYNKDVLAMLHYCHQAAKDMRHVNICGFSYAEHAKAFAVHAVKDLPSSIRFIARDAYSQQRFYDQTGREAVLGADPAFLMPPKSILPDKIDQWLNSPEPVVGLNVSGLLAIDASFLRNLLNALPECRFILIAHDVRKGFDDRDSLDLQLANIHDTHRHRVLRAYGTKHELSAPQVKFLIGRLTAVFTQRMHVAIAALGSGVPVISQEYNGKVAGCFKHFDLERLVLHELSISASHVATSLWEAISNRANLSKQIITNLDRVIELARLNA